jgi:FtsZ-binding cell division protein ZapB
MAAEAAKEKFFGRFVCLPLRGQRRLGKVRLNLSLLLPVELRPENQAASTNGADCKLALLAATLQSQVTQRFTMADTTHIDQIAERVELLLSRYQELQRTNAQLHQQVRALEGERDLLKSRLNAARARIDALLDRLPANGATSLGGDA